MGLDYIVGITYLSAEKYLTKVPYDMKTKVSIKNQNITAFGGIFQVEDLFNHRFSKLIDTSLGLRSPSGKGYQFSEVFCNVNSETV